MKCIFNGAVTKHFSFFMINLGLGVAINVGRIFGVFYQYKVFYMLSDRIRFRRNILNFMRIYVVKSWPNFKEENMRVIKICFSLYIIKDQKLKYCTVVSICKFTKNLKEIL